MKYVDLTMLINENTPIFPGDQKPTFEQIAIFENDGWNEHRFTLNSHFGTHIDFPYHMIQNGKTQDDFALESLIGTGKLIDVRGQIKIHASLSGVKQGDTLLFLTHNSQEKNAEKYFKSYPVMTEELANEIIKRKVKIVGIDSWTPDACPFPIHKLLLSNGVLIVENLVNLQALLNQKFKVFVAPLRMDLFDGCPARVFAEVED